MIVCIPTCGESPHLEQLVRAIADGGHKPVVLVNNVDDEQRTYAHTQATRGSARAVVAHIGNDMNLYAVWNHALALCRAQGGVGAIVNDDIQVHPSSFEFIEAELLRGTYQIVGWDAWGTVTEPFDVMAAPREVYGTYKTRGLAGFAFAFLPDVVPDFDEEYHWWWGDDDWVAQCKARNLKLAVLPGCGVRHHTSTSQIARPWVLDHNDADEARYKAKWG